MTVTMKAKYQGLAPTEIASLEKRLSLPLPDSYRKFLMSGNVSLPEPNVIQGQNMLGSVSKFLGVSANPDDDLLGAVATYRDRLPEGVFPVALAGGGNLVCIDSTNGRIYLWDHEEEANEGEVAGFDNMHFVAGSFEKFIESMTPFDSSATLLKAEDIISVKLKPGFADKFKDYM
jgi:hypothetical protein